MAQSLRRGLRRQEGATFGGKEPEREHNLDRQHCGFDRYSPVSMCACERTYTAEEAKVAKPLRL